MIWYRLTPGKFRLIAVPVRARLPTVSPKSAATRPVMPSGVWPRKRYAPWFRFKYSPRSAQDTSTVLDSVSRCRENTKPSKSSLSPRWNCTRLPGGQSTAGRCLSSGQTSSGKSSVRAAWS